VHHFQNAGKAGAPILGRLVALHLLRLDPKAARQALLRHSRRYACSDQGFGQILDAFENHSFAPAGVEPLVGFNLLSQFLDLTPSRLALGIPQSSADVRRARLTGQLGDCVLKPQKPLLLRRASLHNWRAESGFLGVIDLLKVAKHGKGENLYLVRFDYIPTRAKGSSKRKLARNSTR
jgi:hypothetical protein